MCVSCRKDLQDFQSGIEDVDFLHLFRDGTNSSIDVNGQTLSEVTKNAQAQLALIRTEIDTMRLHLQALEEHKARLSTQIELSKLLCAPIRTLPDDVLRL